jgi:hypothetical protein
MRPTTPSTPHSASRSPSHGGPAEKSGTPSSAFDNPRVLLAAVVGATCFLIWGCDTALDTAFPARKILRSAAPAPYDCERQPYYTPAGH